MRGGRPFAGCGMMLDLFGFLIGLGILAVLIFVVVRLVMTKGDFRRAFAFTGRPSTPPPPAALAILDERLARGDIGVEEYRARKDALLHSQAPPPPPGQAPAPEPGPTPAPAEPPAAPTAEPAPEAEAPTEDAGDKPTGPPPS